MSQFLALILLAGLITLKFKGLIPSGLEWLSLAGIAFSASVLFNYFAIRLGHQYRMVDDPDGTRKIHKEPTPLTGGLAIVLAFAFTVLLNFHFSWKMKGVILGSGVVFLAGFLDDLRDLSAKKRLMLQLLAAGVLIYFDVRVTFVPDRLGGFVTECVITTVWLLGITNAMNFLDGMDGLAAGITMIIAAFFAIFAMRTGQGYLGYLCVALIGSCMGFFLYNFRLKQDALVFLGDGGSNFLGFFLAGVAIMGEWGSENTLDLVIPAVIMGVLIFDMSMTTLLRIRSGRVRNFSEWVHFTGKDHFHHRLTDMGFSPKGAVIMIFLSCMVSGFGALVLDNARGADTLFVILEYVFFFVLIAYLMLPKGDARNKTES